MINFPDQVAVMHLFGRFSFSKSLLIDDDDVIVRTGSIKNVMQKMHSIVWMALILTDEKFAFNSLVMVELLLRIVVTRHAIVGKTTSSPTIFVVWIVVLFCSSFSSHSIRSKRKKKFCLSLFTQVFSCTKLLFPEHLERKKLRKKG